VAGKQRQFPAANRDRQNENGPSVWLDRNKPVEQMTWYPGLPMRIRDRLVSNGGLIIKEGVTCFNLYRPPIILPGDAGGGRALDSARLFGLPNDARHIIEYLAFKVQFAGIKINHALVFGGLQGIGKDTILEPVKYAVGPWNFQEVKPTQVIGRFNGFIKSVIVRISEARDLGDLDRYQLYDHTKDLICAPPDVLRCDEKHLREHSVMNVCGVIMTTNYKTSGIYLPADDRRHFVAYSDRQPPTLKRHIGLVSMAGMSKAGIGTLPRTFANSTLPNLTRRRRRHGLRHGRILSMPIARQRTQSLPTCLMKWSGPDATTLRQIMYRAAGKEIHEWLHDRRNRRAIPHRMEQCRYVPVRNPDAKEDGYWKIGDTRQAVYARKELSVSERIKAARKLCQPASVEFP
jgi:Family of unknown function (DUF5906)